MSNRSSSNIHRRAAIRPSPTTETAFDALIRYGKPNGQRGFVAFEVKYSECCTEPAPPIKDRYAELSRETGLFIDPDAAYLRVNPPQQLWREHCLAQAMVKHGLYDEGRFVLIAPRLNRDCQNAAGAYACQLAEPHDDRVVFMNWHLEDVIEAIRSAGAGVYAQQLHRRYCDFWLVDGEIELALDARRARTKQRATRSRTGKQRRRPRYPARGRRRQIWPRIDMPGVARLSRTPPISSSSALDGRRHSAAERERTTTTATGNMDKRIDIHQHVTDQIVAMLGNTTDQVRLPWHRPGGNAMRPVNVATGKRYRGVNILTLWATANAKDFASGVWGTYRQWQHAGAQVRKGEKASFVVIYKEVHTASDEESGEPGTRLFARASAVFAAEQVDGWINPIPDPLPRTGVTKIAHAEAFVAATSAVISHGGTQAFYRPSDDTIRLPHHDAFIGTSTSSPTESYYAVLLHELTHWTARADRCDRELGRRFGDDGYAMEELVAELGAAFICADLDLTPQPRPDHAHYLAHWLRILQADKRAIFTAAAKASEAVSFLAGFRQSPEQLKART